MKLIIGLGNPGFRYRNTRHNIGFLVIREIARKNRIPVTKKKYKGLLGKGSLEGENVTLFMPQTYMNLSGDAVGTIVKRNNVKVEDMLVICDDVDLELGYLRLRKNGQSGGQKGLKSIMEALGTSEFARLRVGIGKGRKERDLANFVLRPFEKAERAPLKDMMNTATACMAMWIKDGPDKAMTRFNKRQFA